MIQRFLIPLLFCGICTGTGQAAQSNADLYRYTVHLDVSNVNARNRETDGNPSAPFRTLEKALDWAHDLWNSEEGDVRLIIHPGKYQGAIRIRNAHRSPRLVIEAEKPGTVWISGAEPVGPWTSVEAGLWTAPWSNRASIEIISNQGPAGAVFRAGSEVVTAGTQWVSQSLTSSNLAEGTYFVESSVGEKPGKILLRMPVAWSIQSGVQAGARPEESLDPSRNAVRIENTGHIVLRGLGFEMLRGRHPAISIRKAYDIVLENCAIRRVAREGISMTACDGIFMRGLRIEEAGWCALNVRDCRNVRMEDFGFFRNLGREAPESMRRNILIFNSSNVALRWGRLTGNGGAALRLEGKNKELKFTQLFFSDHERGLEVGAGSGTPFFTNCVFEGDRAPGFLANGVAPVFTGFTNAEDADAQTMKSQLDKRWNGNF